ncbi:MAG TPA: molybdopterin cofactor-binding domain-containing protein [Pirellulaceae bacterium]|nr:molybdopterin cofactor-binding domain-containing protein [Pirellulaceae bacterium]
MITHPKRQRGLAERADYIEPERYELFAEPKYHFALDRRDFLRIAGGGIVICLLAADADGQQRGPRRGGFGGGGPTELSAWLHIDEAGQVTVYTGKAEVGQNIRTSLSQAVAEELRVPMASIKLVMADTSLVPPDSGTFGSRTTPDMAARLRRMAAAARETLLDLAAEQAKVERTSLVAADGRVTHPPSEKSFTYGELTKGQKLAKAVSGEVATTPVEKWKVLGTSAPKVDAAAFVTGRHQYTSDLKLPGMLYGKVLRPATLRGTLTSVDASAAKAMPGVVVVHDGPFVGVAAPDEFVAEKGLAAIKAATVITGDEISDTTLYEDLKRTGSSPVTSRFGGRGGDSQGSVDEGLAAAEHKHEAKYTIAYIAHAPLEPRAAVAQWQDGKLTVWTGTQAPFRVRDNLARAFDLAPDKVRVIVPDTGSGYGGKHTNEAATEAARLAKAAGKPVKLVWTRQEEFTWAYFRPAGLIEVNAGITKDGLLTAWDFHNYNSGGSSIRPLYDIPNLRAQSHNSRAPLAQGSYRALAATANHFARESHIDDLAAVVKIDPLAFRLKNLKDERLRAVLEAAAKQFGWEGAQSTETRGIGIAGGSEKGSYVATCAEVAIDRASGKVRVVRAVTAFECGAIVNPDHLMNQVEGCVVMGLGGALFEAIHFDGGKISTDGFSSYRVPRFRDAPQLETVLVNRPDLPSAGAGETPIVAIAPAIGNAIFAATGIRLRSLPMVPEGLKS